ncbi:MAG: hypothetical protein MK097_19870 [Dechloromonas sp.]|nr:hypothetical protein [Dechloromonas sp.]
MSSHDTTPDSNAIAAFATQLGQLCDDARRHIDILSPELEHGLFDTPEFVEQVSRLARSGPNGRIRILIQDSRAMVERGHRLLELARRLPSRIEIRKLAEHPQWNGETCVTRDTGGVLVKTATSRRSKIFELDSRPTAGRYRAQFDALWRYAESAPELRSLQL